MLVCLGVFFISFRIYDELELHVKGSAINTLTADGRANAHIGGVRRVGAETPIVFPCCYGLTLSSAVLAGRPCWRRNFGLHHVSFL